MARPFAKISFTPDVKAVQQEMGSRSAYLAAELGDTDEVRLGAREQAFIADRDSFYMATVNQSGWPYIQHRGGAAGFVKVLGPRTLGFADFSGNRQYLSVGNLRGEERVSLFLMDYAKRQRLKIWGRALVVTASTAPELLAALEMPDYRATVERGIVIEVEAFDWNCPKYITPRYSQREIDALLLQQREVQKDVASTVPVLGNGALPLVVSGITQLTPRIRAYELRHAESGMLPTWKAGAHLRVPVEMPDGSVSHRMYSLTSIDDHQACYRIAVLRMDDGDGGSAALHRGWTMGTRINVDEPTNYFPLHEDTRPAVLIAGGIGITPIKAMVETLAQRGAEFELHYSGHNQHEMAFATALQKHFPAQFHGYFTQAATPSRLDVLDVMKNAPADAVFYVCGPEGLIESVRQAATQLGIANARVQFESFL